MEEFLTEFLRTIHAEILGVALERSLRGENMQELLLQSCWRIFQGSALRDYLDKFIGMRKATPKIGILENIFWNFLRVHWDISEETMEEFPDRFFKETPQEILGWISEWTLRVSLDWIFGWFVEGTLRDKFPKDYSREFFK